MKYLMKKSKKIKIEQNVEKDIELTKKLGYKFKTT